ncbi:hypothetical protein GCM10020001_084310 [Nonomuraea salmonea]
MPPEDAVEGLRRAEPRLPGHRVERQPGDLQEPPGGVSARLRSTYRPGDMPVWAVKTREKCRWLMPARAASAGTLRSAAGFASM